MKKKTITDADGNVYVMFFGSEWWFADDIYVAGNVAVVPTRAPTMEVVGEQQKQEDNDH